MKFSSVIFRLSSLVVLISFFNTSGISQKINTLKKGNYSVDGETFKKKDLGPILLNNKEASETYRRYLKRIKHKDQAAQAGIITAVIGSGILIYGALSSIGGGTTSSERIFYTGAIVAPVGLLIALYAFFPSKYLLKDAIDLYNDSYAVSKPPLSTINSGVTNHGAGLVYSF